MIRMVKTHILIKSEKPVKAFLNTDKLKTVSRIIRFAMTIQRIIGDFPIKKLSLLNIFL
jgi:hypothetical protein